jgi:hypothetical protein
MSTLLYDLRCGFRMLMKNPGFTFTALITLALGIASSTAPANYINWAAQNDVFSQMSASRGEQCNLSDSVRPASCRAMQAGSLRSPERSPIAGL